MLLGGKGCREGLQLCMGTTRGSTVGKCTLCVCVCVSVRGVGSRLQPDSVLRGSNILEAGLVFNLLWSENALT